MRFRELRSAAQLEELVNEIGFLPFFENRIPGFSVEENCPRDHWFVDGVDGPWEWKSQIAEKGNIAYGKFFGKKAGYISNKWIPDFCNFRRDGYDFDALYDDAKATRKSKDVVDLLTENGSMLSFEIKQALGYRKGGLKGFETVITSLQMQGYVAMRSFEHRKDKDGKEYGWGVGRYELFESLFGEEYVTSAYSTEPAESGEKMVEQLKLVLPDIDEKTIRRFIK